MDYGQFPVLLIIMLTVSLALCLALFIYYRKSLLNEKLLTEQLNAMAELAEKRSEFFSNMAHELKTPISVILGAVQLIGLKEREQEQSPEQSINALSKNLGIISCNCYRLLRLTNNLLDLNRIEAGYLVLKPVCCDLNQLLSDMVQSVRPFAFSRQLSLNFSGSAEQIPVFVDVEKMERIMLNLLSNAVKFTKPGGIIIVSTYVSEDRAYISVKDSGTGIPEENREMIFERYKQAGCDRSAENEGSGIGLSLVRSFVRLHQGNIRVTGEVGKGTEFIIDLPLKPLKGESVEYGAEYPGSRFEEAAKIEFSSIHSVPM